jgi:hypothetical protein
MHRAWLGVCVLTLGACEFFTGTGPCDLSIRPAIVVEIRHAQTNGPLADSAAGVVIDGSYSDSLRAWQLFAGPVTAPILERYAAPERAGTYTVFVKRAGFQDWSISGVRVRDDGGYCNGVRTVTLQANMMPLHL